MICPCADNISRDNNIIVCRDTLFNVGGAIASHLEWAAIKSGGGRLLGNLDELWSDTPENVGGSDCLTGERQDYDLLTEAMIYEVIEKNVVDKSQDLT